MVTADSKWFNDMDGEQAVPSRVVDDTKIRVRAADLTLWAFPAPSLGSVKGGWGLLPGWHRGSGQLRGLVKVLAPLPRGCDRTDLGEAR